MATLRRRAAGHLAADQVVGAQIGQHGHLGVEQGHVDVLALAHRFSIDSIKSVASNYLKDNFSAVTQTDSWTFLFDNFVAKK